MPDDWWTLILVPMPDDSLFRAVFDISEEDVATLRAGTLPPAQAQRVKAATRKDAVSMTVIAGLLTVVLVPILVLLVHDGRVFRDVEGSSDKVAVGVIVLLTAGLPVSSIAWSVRTWIAHARTVLRTESVEGLTRLIEHRHRGLVVLRELETGGKRLGISDRVHSALRDGEGYRVFYVPGSDVVVWIEPLPGG